MLQTPFPLGDLPPELQDEIWTLTLRTTPKIFHVASSSPSPTNPSFHRITFHHSHRDATPPAVFICRQSHAAARRAGFVPFPQPDGADPVWLHAGRDILFLDTQICGHLLSRSPEVPLLSLVPALRAVRNVGIEQGIRMPNTPRAVEAYEGAVVRDFIASLMGEVLKAVPRIEVLHYLAPIVGSWDDRPVNVLDCVITPLDPEVGVWRQRRAVTRTWTQVRLEFIAGLEALDLPRGPPALKAWRLTRQHPLGICHGGIVGTWRMPSARRAVAQQSQATGP